MHPYFTQIRQQFVLFQMSEMNSNIITLTGISHRYDSHQDPLHFEDLHIKHGVHTLILGDSGSGKTTLLHILSGLLRPTTGDVRINGQSLYTLPTKKMDHFRGQHIGLVFQDAHLVKSLTIRENLKIAQMFARKPADNTRIEQVLALLRLEEKADSYPNNLSRGQSQRAAIARAVVNKPSILVADEPTASLDDVNTEIVLKLLLEQAEEQGATLIIATHDKRVKSQIQHTYQVHGKGSSNLTPAQ